MQSSSQIPVADVLCIYQECGDESDEQISEHIITYHLLPEHTISVHVTTALVWLVWILPPAVYHCLPNITRGPIWLCPARENNYQGPASARRHNTQWIRLCVMWCYYDCIDVAMTGTCMM